VGSKKARKKSTYAQRQVQELAWFLYISMGYHSNVLRARVVNSYTMEPRALLLMDKVCRAMELVESDIRQLIKEL
jgi:hypothetical protein